MDYKTVSKNLDMGILGQQEVDIEYQLLDGKPDVLGVWLYNFGGANHAVEVMGMLTDSAHDEVYRLCMVDAAENLVAAAEYNREKYREAAWEIEP